MRAFIEILLIFYLAGVGVELAPALKASWDNGSAARCVGGAATELQRAFSWPATVYRNIAAKPGAPERPEVGR
jgi:hypothetical protein